MAEPASRVARDIVVVGASAGGVEALRELVSRFPSDLPAAVFVVLHMPATGTSVLPSILGRAGDLPALHAVDGEDIERGRVYVAPPDRHLVFEDGVVRLSRSARENGHRPAIDPLFRSAAETHGARVTGVVLSGTLDDGAAGLRDVRHAGGATLVQDPEEALYASMPRAAITYASPDEVLPVRELADAVVRLAEEPIPEEVLMSNQRADAAAEVARETTDDARPGVRSAYSCPDCGGSLWEVEASGLLRFRCRVGHAYSEASMLENQARTLENALWTSLRIVEERAAFCRRLSNRLAQRGSTASASAFRHQAEEAERAALELKHVIAIDGLLLAPEPVAGEA